MGNAKSKRQYEGEFISLDDQLLAACREGDVQLAKELIDRGAKASYIHKQYGDWGRMLDLTSPMHLALLYQKPNEELVTLLLDHGADPNAMYAVNRYPDNSHTTTSFHMAISARMSVATLRKFIAKGANVNTRMSQDSSRGTFSVSPLHTAVQKGSVEVTKLLLEAGAAVDSPTEMKGENERGLDEALEETALHMACLLASSSESNQAFGLELVSLLVKHGADVNAQRNYLETRQVLLPGKVVLQNQSTAILSTPLHIAVNTRNPTLVNLLLLLKADKNISYINGGTSISTYHIETSPAVEAALHHFWKPEFHKFYPKIVKDAILSILIISKRQKWQMDKSLLLHLISFVATAYVS